VSEVIERAVVFKCGEASLVGVLHPGGGLRHRNGVLIVVGGPQYRVGSHRQFLLTARALARQGHDVFRFDYRGMGDGEGEYAGFENCTDDIRAAVDVLLRERPHLKGVVLYGLCDGASAALMYAPTDPRIAGLVLANPWVRTESTQAATVLRHYYWKRPFQRSFWAKFAKGGVSIRRSLSELASSVGRARSASSTKTAAPESFVERMLNGLRAFNGQVLLLISGKDLTAQEFSDVCGRDLRWQRAIDRDGIERKPFPSADHTFSQRASLDEATAACCQWLALLDTSHVAVEPVRRAGVGTS
jgi:exosortase A-associated hydrolase 1